MHLVSFFLSFYTDSNLNRSFSGGIQIIVCGDFYQLPPVPDKHPLCIRCGHEHFDTVKPEKSTLPQEIIPAGLTPYPIRQCTDSRRGGEIEKGCGFQFRDRKFAFETEAWRVSSSVSNVFLSINQTFSFQV